jgi:hypothetical protein
MTLPPVAAACALALVGCSEATSPQGSGPQTGAPEAGGGACDAGDPADIYATSQPFECNESLQTVATRGVTLAFDLVVSTPRISATS